MALFEQRIKSLRQEKGLSQTEAARKLGISNQTLYHYEQGREPSYKKLIKIATLYNTTTDYLTGFSDIRTSNDNGKSNYNQENFVAVDFSKIDAVEENLRNKKVSRDDISKLMCFKEIFEKVFSNYLDGEVLFDSLPVDAMNEVLSFSVKHSINSYSEDIAENSMILGVKLQSICMEMYKKYIGKQGERAYEQKE